MYGIGLTFFALFFNIEEDGVLYAAAVVYGYEEATGGRIIARGQAMLKNEQRQIKQLTVSKEAAQQIRLCKG